MGLKKGVPMEIIYCKDCIHRPYIENEKVKEPKDIDGYTDYTCPLCCDDSYYNRMPADDFFCAYGEKRKYAILVKDMTMPTSCDKCPFFDTMVDGICSLLHKKYDLRGIGLRMRECPLMVVEEKKISDLIEVAGKENE